MDTAELLALLVKIIADLEQDVPNLPRIQRAQKLLVEYEQYAERHSVRSLYNQALELARAAGVASLEELAFAATGKATPVSADAAHKRVIKPKYRDPQTGETWAGRGKAPKWLQRKLDAGQSKDDFLI